jgi:hypothetical protein
MAETDGFVTALDPGIRDLVVRLNAAGFTTSDSGDGVSKAEHIAAGDALPFRHVACVVSRDDLFTDADRLAALLGETWTVEASYHPAAGGRCLLFASESTCPHCGGMGETTHDIMVGADHDTEQRECSACKGTGVAAR